MNNYREILFQLLWRVAVAVPLWFFAWFILMRARGGFGAVPQLLCGMVFFIAAALVMAPPIARFIAEPTGRLFYPSEHYDRPQPIYGIPESLRSKGEHEQAFELLAKIAREHPDQLKAYVYMVEIAVMDMGNGDLARATYRQGLNSLKKEKDRDALTNMFEGIITRLAPPTAKPAPAPLKLGRRRDATPAGNQEQNS